LGLVFGLSVFVEALIVLGCCSVMLRFGARYPLSTHKRILAMPTLLTGLCAFIRYGDTCPGGGAVFMYLDDWGQVAG
jgi:hypothetical protein